MKMKVLIILILTLLNFTKSDLVEKENEVIPDYDHEDEIDPDIESKEKSYI
jgi:hypothetical protein